MSDFLSRLAGRSMGLAPVVQPAIPAITSPVPRNGSLPEDESFREASDELIETASPVSPSLSAAHDGIPQTPANAPFAPSLTQRHRDVVTGPATENLLNAGRAPLESALDATLLQPGPTRDHTARASLTHPAWDRTFREATPSHPPESAPERTDRRSLSPTASPVVRVTIGRVEVRAEFASPKVRQAAAPQPKPAAISLDDYLKQRSEGRR
jgi:hypothetical protein